MSGPRVNNRQRLRSIVVKLLQSGAHFGHAAHHWNPKMSDYIFTERGGQHVIDLEQTATALQEARATVREVAARGGKIIFVGTKRQAHKPIEDAAKSCGMHYINNRWLGGTLTNWQTISERIKYLNERDALYEAGEFNSLNKKERLGIKKEIDKLNRRLGGIRELTALPDLIFVVDTKRESLAVNEATRTNVPIIAMVDTNCDPDPITCVIPSNDDSHRPIRYITGVIADAVREGTDMFLKDLVDAPEDYDDADEFYDEHLAGEEEEAARPDEELLGEGALKLIAEQTDEEEEPASGAAAE